MRVTETVARRLWVSGRVQGVAYRAWTVTTARALGLAGWVRNRRDGRVEILAQGSAGAIDELVRQCRVGPAAAAVSDVTVETADAEPLTDFSQRPTL